MFLHYLDAIGDGTTGEIVVEPIHVAADIGDAGMQAKRLGDEHAALFIEGEADGICEHRLGGPQADFQVLRHAEARDGLFALVGRAVDFRLVGLVIGRREVEQCGARGAEEQQGQSKEAVHEDISSLDGRVSDPSTRQAKSFYMKLTERSAKSNRNS